MKILSILKEGFIVSLKSWRGVLIVWICSLMLIALVVMPINSALKSGLGNSMITEKMNDGINIEVFADMGANFKSLISYFSAGLLMVFIFGFVLNSFLSGGLFTNLKTSAGKFHLSEFFLFSAKNFWPFLIISLIINLIILITAILIFLIPVSIVAQAESASEGAVFKTAIIAGSVFLLTVTLLILVADYARAWQVLQENKSGLRALGFGFGRTFKTFSSSFLLMLIVLIMQLLYGWFFVSIISGTRPGTGGGIFLLFILSQVLFIFKIVLKTWRYGSVTKMLEMNS